MRKSSDSNTSPPRDHRCLVHYRNSDDPAELRTALFRHFAVRASFICNGMRAPYAKFDLPGLVFFLYSFGSFKTCQHKPRATHRTIKLYFGSRTCCADTTTEIEKPYGERRGAINSHLSKSFARICAAAFRSIEIIHTLVERLLHFDSVLYSLYLPGLWSQNVSFYQVMPHKR